MRPIELNELPRYSKPVAEILRKESKKHLKDNEQIDREFGTDKWGGLLRKWLANPCGINEVRDWECELNVQYCGIVENQLRLMTASEGRQLYYDLIERALLDDQAEHLVEIGCGYGSVLFDLINRKRLLYKSTTGLEYTKQGIDLARHLASWHQWDVTLGSGDYNKQGITDLNIVPGSDIFSSYSLHYIRDARVAIENLIQLKPKRVLHFEPIYEYCHDQTVLGLLQQKYMENQDYNLNILRGLREFAIQGSIEIIKEEPMIFGTNCLLPASLVIWRPVK